MQHAQQRRRQWSHNMGVPCVSAKPEDGVTGRCIIAFDHVATACPVDDSGLVRRSIEAR